MAIRSMRDDDVDLERDRILVERCQAGDRSAFDLLYTRYHDRLTRFCVRRIGDRHEAEDAAQEAFARAWKALPTFAGDRRFYPWLSVIAANLCTDILRKRSRNLPMSDTDIDHLRAPMGLRSAGEDERFIESVDCNMAMEALERVSPRHREVLVQREQHEWTYQQIADYHDVRITTVEALIWRARKALKKEFAELAGVRGVAIAFCMAVAAFARKLTGRGQSSRSALPTKLAAFHAVPVIGGAVVVAGTSAALIFGGIVHVPGFSTARPSPSPVSSSTGGAAIGSTGQFPVAAGAAAGRGGSTGGAVSGVSPTGGIPGSVSSTASGVVGSVGGTVAGVLGTTGAGGVGIAGVSQGAVSLVSNAAMMLRGAANTLIFNTLPAVEAAFLEKLAGRTPGTSGLITQGNAAAGATLSIVNGVAGPLSPAPTGSGPVSGIPGSGSVAGLLPGSPTGVPIAPPGAVPPPAVPTTVPITVPIPTTVPTTVPVTVPVPVTTPTTIPITVPTTSPVPPLTTPSLPALPTATTLPALVESVTLP